MRDFSWHDGGIKTRTLFRKDFSVPDAAKLILAQNVESPGPCATVKDFLRVHMATRKGKIAE
jgi:hypothetical protein